PAPADDDNDGVPNTQDECDGTAAGADVDANGCSADQRDSDGDGVSDADDNCADTPSGTEVDDHGCPVDGGGDDGGNGGHNPPGNNGTIKIDDEAFDDHPNNEPHVGCTFQVDFYGYDKGDYYADVNFELQSPTKNGRTLEVTSGDLDPFIGEDDASGGGSEAGLDASETYTLKFTGAPHAKQGYHVKLTINAPGSQGKDVKHKVFWVEGCEQPQPPTEVTPAAPTSHDVCGTANDTYTVPSTEGVDYLVDGKVVKAGTYPGSGSVTVTAKAQDGYKLKGDSSWTFQFTDEPCQQPPTEVTPAAPSSTTPTCDNPNETVTPGDMPGVVWSPSGPTTLKPGESVTYTASPAEGYEFPQGAQTEWTFTNNFDTSKCETPPPPPTSSHDFTVSPNQGSCTVMVPQAKVVFDFPASLGYQVRGSDETHWVYTEVQAGILPVTLPAVQPGQSVVYRVVLSPLDDSVGLKHSDWFTFSVPTDCGNQPHHPNTPDTPDQPDQPSTPPTLTTAPHAGMGGPTNDGGYFWLYGLVALMAAGGFVLTLRRRGGVR
ncbi:MAG TPA: hypothetical protein VFG56_02815, partial [Candidatus Saccharimonadales bacterium]|nr:hypothetical protein [Candidatus Saccharimonadales bacterium]